MRPGALRCDAAVDVVRWLYELSEVRARNAQQALGVVVGRGGFDRRRGLARSLARDGGCA
jgi:hypothetical protein